MQNHKVGKQHDSGNAKAAESEQRFDVLEVRRDPHDDSPHERRKNDEDGKRQQANRANKNIKNGFGAQHIPRPRIAHVVGAVEPNAQRFNSARSEVDREHCADRQQPGMGMGEHVVDFGGERSGNAGWHGIENQSCRFVG